MAIINRIVPPFNGTMQTQRPYVDDIFDPLFNKQVTDYYSGMYGNRLVGTLAGYADMWDNALTGREGILGPGMGVLSTFGRSMDKADDFILGGLTEGVNWLGQRFGGNNPDPVNPIKNIMVNDYDYQGARLMAAAGNAMSKLVGTQTPLTEANFDTLGDRIAGTSIDLLTDPGILGGRLATLKPGTPVGDVGHALDTYDNFMAKHVAGNMALPGGRYLAEKGIHQIRDLLGARASKDYMDLIIGRDRKYTENPTDDLNTPNIEMYEQMVDDYAKNAGINPIDSPEAFEAVKEVKRKRRSPSMRKEYDAYLKTENPRQTYYDFITNNRKMFETRPDNMSKELFDEIQQILYKYDNMDDRDKIKNYLIRKKGIKNTDQLNSIIDQHLKNYNVKVSRKLKNYLDKHISNAGVGETFKLFNTPHSTYEEFKKSKIQESTKLPESVKNSMSFTDDIDNTFNEIQNIAAEHNKEIFKNINDATGFVDEYTPRLIPKSKKYDLDAFVEDAFKESGRKNLITDELGEVSERSVLGTEEIDNVLQDFEKELRKRADINDNIYDYETQTYIPIDDFLDEFRYLQPKSTESKRLKLDTQTDDEYSNYIKEYDTRLSTKKSLLKDFISKNARGDDAISNYISEYDFKKPSTYMLASSTAGLRKATAAKVVDNINLHTAELISKHPEYFENVDMSNVNAFTNNLTHAIKRSFTENILSDAQLSRMLLSKVVYEDGTPHVHRIKETLEYLRKKYPKDKDIWMEYVKLQDLALEGKFDEVRKIIYDNPRLNFIMFDKVYAPNLKNIFGEFSSTKQGIKNDINTFLNNLSKEVKHADGTTELTGLLPSIFKHKDVLMRTSFGKDLLDWAENVQKTIDAVSYKTDILSGLTPKVSTEMFKNTVSGYNTLVNTLPKVDVKLVNGQRIYVDKVSTPQGFLLTLLKDRFDRHVANASGPLTITLPKDIYNHVLKGNENNYYLKSFLESLKADAFIYGKRGENKLLKPAFKDLTLTFDIGSDGKYILQDAFEGLEQVDKAYYITNNDALRYFKKYSEGNEPDFRKVFVNPHEEYVKLIQSKQPIPEAVASVNKQISEMPVEQAAETLIVPKSATQVTVDNLKFDIFSQIDERFPQGSKYDVDNLPKLVWEYGTVEERRFFTLLDRIHDRALKNKVKRRLGVTRLPAFRRILEKVNKLSKKYKPEQVAEYFKISSEIDDQIIKGDDMLTYIIGSGGHVETVLKDEAMLNNLRKTIKSNVEKVNKHGDILEYFEREAPNGTVVGYRFNVNNTRIKKDINKYYGLINKVLKKNEALDDMVFFKGTGRDAVASKLDGEYAELEALFSESRHLSQDLSKTLGFSEFNDNYFKFAMRDDDAAKKFFSGWAKTNGNDLKHLNEVSEALMNFNFRGTFGTVKYNKAYLGSFDNYSEGFSTNLSEVIDSTYTKGMFDNTHAQTFLDLFVSGDFSINKHFDSVDTLKKALFLKDDSGKLTGNLDNVEIVTPKYNNEGRLIGFKRYNKFSDIDLDTAFKDENAVLLPTHVISPLDRMLKKDIRMSNKLYQFINKYITVPFKFGTLSNPGFLVGNMGDAYFKQAVEMSKKYGTNLEDELAEVAMSMREVTILNNQFDKIFKNYLAYLVNDSTIKSDVYRPSVSYAKNKMLSPDIVMNNPKFSKAWEDYLNSAKLEQLSAEDRRVAQLYTFVNIRQNTSTFNNNNLDLEDVLDKKPANQYDVPTNIVERAMYGDPSVTKFEKNAKGKLTARKDKGIRSWGMFVNNPISNQILKTSNQVESYMRSASIINDLKHKGYSRDKICHILGLPNNEEVQLYEKLRVDMQNAINTMHASNFDYDQVSPLMDKMSYIMPFPTFYLKNIAYWMDILVERPEMIDDIISVHEGMWTAKNEDTKTDEFAAEAKGRGAVPVHTGNKYFAGFVKQTPYTSMFGAFNAMNDPRNDMAFRVNPIARPVTRHLQDDEDVRYRPYSMNMYEKNINAEDPKFNDLAYMFHQLNPYERFTQNALRFPQKMDRGELKLSDFASSIVQPDF